MKNDYDKFPPEIFPLNRYILNNSMKSAITSYKKNSYQKEIDKKYTSYKARDLLSKVEFVEQFDKILPKSLNIFENLFSFTERTSDNEKILFIVAKEIINQRSVYLKIIENHLDLMKSKRHSNRYVRDRVEELENEGDLIRIRYCPKCGHTESRISILCKKCGNKIIQQAKNFEKESNKPYYLIELTKHGWDRLNSVVKTFLNIGSFFTSWLKLLEFRDLYNFKDGHDTGRQ